eukprot:4607713-Ditylum_brightwellii.AAC.1
MHPTAMSKSNMERKDNQSHYQMIHFQCHHKECNRLKLWLTMVKETDHLWNYLTMYPNAAVCFCASDVLLYIHSDVAYMVLLEARSCVGGYFYLSNRATTNDASDVPINGTIHNE